MGVYLHVLQRRFPAISIVIPVVRSVRAGRGGLPAPPGFVMELNPSLPVRLRGHQPIHCPWIVSRCSHSTMTLASTSVIIPTRRSIIARTTPAITLVAAQETCSTALQQTLRPVLILAVESRRRTTRTTAKPMHNRPTPRFVCMTTVRYSKIRRARHYSRF